MVRIDELEGLRGFLAVWVVVVHLLPAANIEPSSLGVLEPLFGELIRVQIFCIMSGFVIFMMMSGRREPYIPYLSRRFLRIYPVFIFAFVLSIAMSGVAYEALQAADFPGSKNANRIAIYESSFAMWPQHLLSHLTLLHGIVPDQWLPMGAYAFLGQGWNISTEFQFYVIAPLLFWVLHDARLSVKIPLLVGIATAWFVGMRWPNGAALSYFAIYFLTGIGSFYAWRRSWKDNALLNKWTIVAAALLVGTLSIAIGMWIFIFGSTLYVRDRGGKEDVLSTTLKLKPMLFLGKISYSLYLLHMIPLYGVMYGLNTLELPQPAYLGLLGLGTFALGIPLSMFATRYVEGAFYQPKSSAAIGATAIRSRQPRIAASADADVTPEAPVPSSPIAETR